jgi:hypothetical protein
MKPLDFIKNKRYLIVILITLILIFGFQVVVVATDLSGLSGYRSLVNAGNDGYISLGNTTSINYLVFDEYSAPVTPAVTTPLDAYFGAKPIVLILPGLLLICFIIWFFYLGTREIRQSEVLVGITYYTLSFVLIGVTLIVAMPLILSGAESIIWFK